MNLTVVSKLTTFLYSFSITMDPCSRKAARAMGLSPLKNKLNSTVLTAPPPLYQALYDGQLRCLRIYLRDALVKERFIYVYIINDEKPIAYVHVQLIYIVLQTKE